MDVVVDSSYGRWRRKRRRRIGRIGARKGVLCPRGKAAVAVTDAELMSWMFTAFVVAPRRMRIVGEGEGDGEVHRRQKRIKEEKKKQRVIVEE